MGYTDKLRSVDLQQRTRGQPMDAPPSMLVRALERDEKLIWWDRPQRGIVLRSIDMFIIPFSIVWASFPESLGAVLFLGVGAYVVAGRFIHDAWRRDRTLYALTNHRILIIQASNCRSLELAGIGEISLQSKGNGKGSIVFGPNSANFGWPHASTWTGAPQVPTFELIPEVARVYAAIRAAQLKARAS